MFDYVTAKPIEAPAKPRYMTTTVSALVHVLVIGAVIGLPILYASDDLPDPPDMMAFVMEAVPPPPPPPPAPAPPKPAEPTPAKPSQAVLQTRQPVPQPVAAPLEAPAAIKPETGLESSGATKIEAGFERGTEGGVVGGAVGGIETNVPAPPPPPPPKPAGPVRIGGQIKAPQLVHRVNPTYPPLAQSAQVQGSVMLEAVVDKTGQVQTVKVVRSEPLLDAAAIAAVKQWRYEPLNLNGEPTPFILTVTVNFSMPK